MPEEIKIRVSVDTGSSASKAQSVADGLNQVAASGKKAAQAAGKVKQEFFEVAGAFSALAIGRQVRDVLLGLVTAADQVHVGMGKVKTVVDSSSSVLPLLKQRIASVSDMSGFSFENVAETVRDLVALGLDPATVAAEGFLGSLVKFQRVAEIPQAAVGGLVKALNNMDAGGAKTEASLDSIASVADASAMSMADMSEIMTKVGPSAANMGQNFRSMTIASAVLSTGFTKGNVEATSLLNALLGFGNIKKAAGLKEAFDVDVKTKTGEYRDLTDVMLEMSQKIPQNRFGELATLFGPKGGGQALSTALRNLREGMLVKGDHRSGAGAIEAFGATFDNSVGEVDRKFKLLMSNMTDQVKRLSVAFDNMLGSTLGVFVSLLTWIVEKVANVISGVRAFADANPIFAHANMILMAIVGTVAFLVSGLLTVFGGVRLAAAGMQFLRKNMLEFITASGTAAQVAKATSASISTIGLAGVGASAGVTTLRGALTGLKAGLGPIGWILLALEGIPLLIAGMQWLFGGGDKAANTAKQAADLQAETAKTLGTVADKFSEVSDKLDSIVDEFTGKALKEFPVFDTRVSGMLADVSVNQSKINPTLDPTQLGMMNEVVTEFLNAVQQGTQTPEHFKRAQIAITQATGYAAQQKGQGVPGAANAHKGLMNFNEQLKASVSPEAALFARRDAAMRTPGASIYAAQGNDVVSIPNAKGLNPLTGKPGAAPPDKASYNQGNYQNATFQNATINMPGGMTLNVDGEPIRAAVENGNAREQGRRLGGY